MDIFNFCWNSLLLESKKCNVFLNKENSKVTNEYDEDFEKPIKRISYLYRYSSFNIYFFKHCLANFIAEVPDSLKIIDKICSTKDLNVCSLSSDPGNYIIGLLYSLLLLGKPLKETVNFNIVCKYGAWRNLAVQMLNSTTGNVLESRNCKLIQCDILTELTPQAKSFITSADILFMCRTFSSSRANKDVISRVLTDISQLLKPGALIFFMTNKEKSCLIKELEMFGQFVYGPNKITLGNIPYDENIAKLVDIVPCTSGSSYFAVWKKSETLPHDVSSVNVVNTSLDNPINLLVQSNSLPNPVHNKNIAGILNIHTSNSMESISTSNSGDSLSLESVPFKPKDEQTATQNSATQTDLIDCTEKLKKLSIKNDEPVNHQNMEASQQSSLPRTSMNSLIKSLEKLVASLEEFNSQNTVRNLDNQRHSLTCSCHSQNVRVKSFHTCCCKNYCACNRFHSSCIQNHHMCSNGFHCNCSKYKQHDCQKVEVPHQVIPLQNASEKTLTQVLSLVSQSNSSFNT